MASNEDLMRELVEMRTELRLHIQVEEPVLVQARALLEVHGSDELVRKRIAFINSWMEREQDYKQLRRAIIEKSLIVAILAIATFVIGAIGLEVREIVRGWIVHKP